MSARELVAEIVAEREQRIYRECIYCSASSAGLACDDCRDLLTLDTHQYAMRLAPDRAAQEGAHTK